MKGNAREEGHRNFDGLDGCGRRLIRCGVDEVFVAFGVFLRLCGVGQ
jgi:hypothetical protein